VISLGAEAEVFLLVLKPSTYNEIDSDNRMEIELRWRFAQPRF
jgi:hypothetical protein